MPRVSAGRLYKQPGSNVWWIDFSYRGKRYRESSGSTVKSKAQELLNKRRGEIENGTFVGTAAARLTFEDMVELLRTDYRLMERRTWERVEYSLRHLRDYFGKDCPALDIDTARIDAYAVARMDAGAAPATIQRELMTLSRMFTLAVKKKKLASKPVITSLKPDNARSGFLRSDDVQAIIRKLPDYAKPIVRFAYLTGWRKGEILSRTWAHVDFERSIIRLEPGETKNKEGRIFPFKSFPALRQLLEEQRERVRTLEKKRGKIIPWVFPHADGERVADIRSAWNRAVKAAGQPGALFHDLRRSAVMNLEAAGVPRSVAKKLTGHITDSVYERYAIADQVALLEGVKKLATYHAGTAKRTRSRDVSA